MKDNDKEIVQTLKNHIEAEDCVTCESFGKCDEFLLTKNTLDLINRQQAEIKQLKKENKILSKNADTAFQDGLNEAQDLYAKQVENEIRDRSMKEFAERLKDKSLTKWDYHDAVDIEEIDNLVKELVGDME